MVEISIDISFIKEVILPRGQFREAAFIMCWQDIRRRQRCHSAISSMDFQYIAEHDAVPRHTLHSPNLY